MGSVSRKVNSKKLDPTSGTFHFRVATLLVKTIIDTALVATFILQFTHNAFVPILSHNLTKQRKYYHWVHSKYVDEF